MNETISIEMTPEEWGQVMMVLQSGVYRVVAPILQKMNNQVVEHMQAQTHANVQAQIQQQPFRVVEPTAEASDG